MFRKGIDMLMNDNLAGGMDSPYINRLPPAKLSFINLRVLRGEKIHNPTIMNQIMKHTVSTSLSKASSNTFMLHFRLFSRPASTFARFDLPLRLKEFLLLLPNLVIW